MKTAAIQSRPSCAKKKLWIDSGIEGRVGEEREEGNRVWGVLEWYCCIKEHCDG